MEKSVNNEQIDIEEIVRDGVTEKMREHKRLLLGFFMQNDGHAHGRKHVDLHDTLAVLFTNYPGLQNDLTQLLPDYRAEASLQNPEPAEHPTLPCNDSVADIARQDGVRDKDFETRRPDIKDCERCTPSYCLLPKDYQIPLASNRKVDDIAVLNDLLVAVTSGSQDHPFDNMRKNKYEHGLFHCEDHRFELDMLIEIANAAIRRVETLLKDIEKKDNPIRLDDRLTASDIRCIEHLYGEDYLKVMDYLRKMPIFGLSLLLTHLEEKKEEWGKCRTDFNATCAEEYAKYHRRSLDYRSPEFKKWDMKSLSTTALLAEIEENSGIESEKGQGHNSISQLELEYSDPDIHYDIYQLIKYSSVRSYRQEHMDKVMNIWKHFLEHMLCVPTGPDDTDAHSEAEESAHTLSNEGIESARRMSVDGDRDGSEYSDGEKGSHDDPDEDVNDNKAEETDDGQDAEYNGLLLFTECFLPKAKPVTKCLSMSSERDSDSRLFYGNNSFYVLFVLHYILYERLKKAKLLSSSAANSLDHYARFVSALNNLLDGSFDQEKFEDECLTILGPQSYILFTLDKLILRIVKHLHGIANSEINHKLIQLYAHESARKPWTSMDNNNYIEKVRRLLSDTNLFRLEYVPAAAQLSLKLMKLCVDEADEERYDGDGDDDCIFSS